MKIIGLKISGMRKLTAAELTIKETGLTPIKGRNKAGKTSVLDALEILFCGNIHVQPDMIQHGQEKMTIEGRVVGEGGEVYNIKKVVTHKTTRLEITDEKGFTASKKPQEFLTSLVSQLSFNPRQFLNLSGSEKLKDMMQLLKIDFSGIDRNIKAKEQERLLVGREVKNFGEIIVGDPVEAVVVSTILEQKQEIAESNRKVQEAHRKSRQDAEDANRKFNSEQLARQTAIDKTQNVYDMQQRELVKIEEQIKKLQQEQEQLQQSQKEIKEGISKLPLPEPQVDVFSHNMPAPIVLQSTVELDQQLADAAETNTRAAAYSLRVETQKKKMEKEAQYTKLSEDIASLRMDKIRVLKDAPMPVPGLAIKPIPGEEKDGEEVYGLFYGDTYSENWSEAEGLLIASQICLSQNPKLRAVFLDKGESMDPITLKEFAKWAEDNDMQAVITIVSEVPQPEDMEDNVWYIEAGEILSKASETGSEQSELSLP